MVGDEALLCSTVWAESAVGEEWVVTEVEWVAMIVERLAIG
jgi:hypothetical protein